MKVIVFEDEGWENFGPVTLLKHTSQLKWGTKSLLDAVVENVTDATEVGLWGREEVGEVSKETLKLPYNQEVEGQTLFVNARARPGRGLLSLTSKKAPFAALASERLVAARLDGRVAKPGVISDKSVKKISKIAEKLDVTNDYLFRGYWELVQSNGLAVAEQARHFEDYMEFSSSVEVRGSRSNLWIQDGVEVEANVTFDTRLGPIMVERGASIESFSRIMGPTFIGAKTKLYSALIGGGTSIFEDCKVGGQVENSVIMPHTNKAHYGYVGDSYVGEWVNLGAGSTFSNLKNTYGNVRIEVAGRRIDSGMLKLGPVLGDMCKVSIGALAYAGRSMGTGSHLAGLAANNVPSFTYFDGASGRKIELRLDSVVETQRRMKERRGLVLSRAEEALIRTSFAMTGPERKKAGVKKGPLTPENR